MKLRILVAAFVVGIIGFTSCLKSKGDTQPDKFMTAMEWYRVVRAHNDAALDPFNIAYRLNMYIKALNDGEEKGQAAKEDLFGYETKITKDVNVYTIEYDGNYEIIKDSKHNGKVIVNTFGNDFNDINGTWDVETSDTAPYYVNTGYGLTEQRISTSYVITNTGDKQWTVYSSELFQKNAEYNTNWMIHYDIKQTKGSLLYQGDEKTFEFRTDPTRHVGGKSFYGQRFKYEIRDAVKYSSSCSFLTKGAGKEVIKLMDVYGITVQDSAVFDIGGDFNCNPSYKITVIIDGKEETRVM